MRILGISGSLRKDSHNTALLRAAAELLPPGVELELFDGLRAVLRGGDLAPDHLQHAGEDLAVFLNVVHHQCADKLTLREALEILLVCMHAAARGGQRQRKMKG